MHFLIIANGLIKNLLFYKSQIKNIDKIICVNGGLNIAKKLKIIPNILIGDLDSNPDLAYLKKNPIKVIKFSPEKNLTDLELAVLYCKNEKAKKITIIGALGNRIDHLLNNLNILRENLNITLIDESHIIFKITKNTKLCGNKGDIISFFPLVLPLEGVKTEGLKYPFTEDWFNKGKISVSNEFSSSEVKIFIKKGALLVIRIMP